MRVWAWLAGGLLLVGVVVFGVALVVTSEPSCADRRQALIAAKAARLRGDDASRRAAVRVRAREARAAGCDVSDLIDDSVGA